MSKIAELILDALKISDIPESLWPTVKSFVISAQKPIYAERNALAVAFARAALAAGWKAGRAHPVDVDAWPVVYVDLPGGQQVSWHIPPETAGLAGLPVYRGEWDGAHTGRDPNWPLLMAAPECGCCGQSGPCDPDCGCAEQDALNAAADALEDLILTQECERGRGRGIDELRAAGPDSQIAALDGLRRIADRRQALAGGKPDAQLKFARNVCRDFAALLPHFKREHAGEIYSAASGDFDRWHKSLPADVLLHVPSARRAWDARLANSPCEFCGHRFDVDALGRYGCPNCEGDRLTKG